MKPKAWGEEGVPPGRKKGVSSEPWTFEFSPHEHVFVADCCFYERVAVRCHSEAEMRD